MAGHPPATIGVGNLRQTQTKPTGLLVAILMAQNSCLGGRPIRSFSSHPPNQRPTNQSKVTIHLASNNPPGGYKRQNGTRNPNARGVAAKPGEEENDEKRRKRKKRKKNRKRQNEREAGTKTRKATKQATTGKKTQLNSKVN